MHTIVKHYVLALCKRTSIVYMYKSIRYETKYAKNIQKIVMNAKDGMLNFSQNKKRYIFNVNNICLLFW